MAGLIRGRPWLFADMRYYTDSTHAAAVLGFARDLEDAGTLRMVAELADYAQALDPMFHYRGEPPFDDPYADNAIYLRALPGEDVDRAIAHFRRKVTASNVMAGDTGPAEVLIESWSGWGAIGMPYRRRSNIFRPRPACRSAVHPSARLCQMAGNYSRLRETSREPNDLLGYAAGLIAETASPR